MRLLHTSDWHLGHALKDVTRDVEHAAFLAWLLETCAREAPDVMLITGDVFDSATPPASAERMWFEFLAASRRARPALDIIAIAGNHDSPARLGAASAVLRELGVHVIGNYDRARCVIEVAGGVIVAVPFLRPIDLPDCEDPLAAVYAEAIAEGRARRRPGDALVVTGHLYVAGAEVSHLSERRVSIGGQESASLRLFPDDIDYVALGHMHRAQRVGRDSIRYAGAPIPLALDEAHYKHSVVLWDGAPRTIAIPRTIDVMQITGALVQVLAEIAMLPVGGDPRRPYLEVIVRLDKPEPRLRTAIETALEGKRARLVRIGTELTGDGATLGERTSARRLAELDPRDVFVQCWSRAHALPPPAAVLGAFDRLLADVQGLA